MEKLSYFTESVMSKNQLNILWGGEKRYSSFESDENRYSDVHEDNDNDGKWSAGDTYTITKLAKK